RITHVVFRFLTHTLYLSLDTHVLTRFFISEPTSTDIYTLSLHDALPILSITSTPERVSSPEPRSAKRSLIRSGRVACKVNRACSDRKSTRLNSSHVSISYAVFCLKKKKNIRNRDQTQPEDIQKFIV